MDEMIECSLPRELTCSGLARRLIEQHFSSQLAEDSLDELKLVASELVENAYLHGEGVIRIKFERVDRAVRLDVTDAGHGARIQIREPSLDGHGNGLRLVDHLCRSWGSFDGSTRVWAELPIRVRRT